MKRILTICLLSALWLTHADLYSQEEKQLNEQFKDLAPVNPISNTNEYSPPKPIVQKYHLLGPTFVNYLGVNGYSPAKGLEYTYRPMLWNVGWHFGLRFQQGEYSSSSTYYILRTSADTSSSAGDLANTAQVLEISLPVGLCGLIWGCYTLRPGICQISGKVEASNAAYMNYVNRNFCLDFDYALPFIISNRFWLTFNLAWTYSLPMTIALEGSYSNTELKKELEDSAAESTSSRFGYGVGLFYQFKGN